MSRLEAGDAAPPFEMAADDGSVVSSEGLKGSRYVLYFYPKDDTPGCTAQACGLRDSWNRVEATRIEVYNVSTDSVKSHVKFRDKYDLPYRLLSDEGHRIAWRPAEPGQEPPGHLWRWELEPIDSSSTRVTHTYDWTQLSDESRIPRARATTADKLQNSLDRLAALAERG